MGIEARIAAAVEPLARRRGLDPGAAATILETDPAPQSDLPAIERVDDVGTAYERSKGTTGARAPRKGDGVYYTPEALVRPTVTRTLEPLDTIRAICDPACGAGAFLLSSMRYLEGRGIDPLPTIHGVDRDPRAVRIARLVVWLEAADPHLDPAQLAMQIRPGDSCIGRWHPSEDRATRDAFCRTWFGEDCEPFHWQLEFANVFERGGFDAVVGNPPWNIEKPDSRDFFSHVDPAYPELPKQKALVRQRELLDADPTLAREWHRRVATHAALGKFVRRANSPFRRQGRGDLNGYKLFTELAWELLRSGGRLGLVVPSGIYSDAGSADLRAMLLDESKWDWVFGFENRRRVFPIDGRFKFAAIVAERGGTTESIRTAFMRTELDDWNHADAHALRLRTADIRALSPNSHAIPEIRHARDAEILERVRPHTHAFGHELGETIRFRREFDQTTDSHRFVRRDTLEHDGFEARPDGLWCRRDEVMVPLYEGRMIGAYDFSEKGWVRGSGRSATWESIPFPDKRIAPQYFVTRDDFEAEDPEPERPKLAFMAIASATNRRSMVATSLFGVACGNSVPTLRGASIVDDLCVLAIANSFVFDFLLRMRLAGTNLNQFVLAETPMLTPSRRRELVPIAPDVAALAWAHPRFDDAWESSGLRRDHALDPWDRRRRRARIDAAVARAFGLGARELGWILRDCAHPRADLSSNRFTRTLDPKGFWREDRDAPPTSRLPQLVLDLLDNRPTCESSSVEAPAS